MKLTALCEYRKRQKMTQRELAVAVGVTACTITQYETGARKPNIVMLKKTCSNSWLHDRPASRGH